MKHLAILGMGLAALCLAAEGQTAADAWNDPPETKPTTAPAKTSQTKATQTAPQSPQPPQSPSSADADAPQSSETAPKRRGRPPGPNSGNSAPKAPAAPPKAVEEMSLAELTKALAKEAAKAKAGHEALAQIEVLNEAIQKRLG